MLRKFLLILTPLALVLSIGATPKAFFYTFYEVNATEVKSTPFSKRWDSIKDLSLKPDPSWTIFIKEIENLTDLQKIIAVNIAVNHHVVYLQENGIDIWQPADMTLHTGRGDCEDYAILKYHLLIEAGIPKDHLFMMLGFHGDIGHAQLIAMSENKYYVLDNNRDSLDPLPNFKPLYILSHNKAWTYK